MRKKEPLANNKARENERQFGSCAALRLLTTTILILIALAVNVRADELPTLELRLPAAPLISRDDVNIVERSNRRVTWYEATTPHFFATSYTSRDETISMLVRLEETYELLAALFPESEHSAQSASNSPSPASSLRHEITIFRDRRAYLNEVVKIDPNASVSWGFYSGERRHSFLFPSPEKSANGSPNGAPNDFESRYVATTLLHEATHQILDARFRRDGGTLPDHDFWVTEGIACYVESLRREKNGDDVWVLGGWDNDRMRAACVRLDRGFFVPLERLAPLGPRAFTEFFDIRPLYSQSAGMTTFFMATHREAMLRYIRDVYAGRRDAATIFSAATGTAGTEKTFAELDDAYQETVKRHVDAIRKEPRENAAPR
ncbi:MAG: hypothetical protein ACRC46_02865 [Thermoguttaceae bacterium]